MRMNIGKVLSGTTFVERSGKSFLGCDKGHITTLEEDILMREASMRRRERGQREDKRTIDSSIAR